MKKGVKKGVLEDKKGDFGGKKVPFRFTLDPIRHSEVISILNSVPKPFRAEFIAESVKMAREYYAGQKKTHHQPPPVNLKGSIFD